MITPDHAIAGDPEWRPWPPPSFGPGRRGSSRAHGPQEPRHGEKGAREEIRGRFLRLLGEVQVRQGGIEPGAGRLGGSIHVPAGLKSRQLWQAHGALASSYEKMGRGSEAQGTVGCCGGYHPEGRFRTGGPTAAGKASSAPGRFERSWPNRNPRPSCSLLLRRADRVVIGRVFFTGGGTTMKCPKCQTENPETNKFCRECGISLSRVCPHCGTEVLPQDKFCGQCGQVLGERPQPTTTAVAFDKVELKSLHPETFSR